MAVESRRLRGDERSQRLCLYVFIPILALSAVSAIAAYFTGDVFITQRLQQYKAPWLHGFMVAISWPGYLGRQWIVAVSVAALLLRFRLRIEAACLLLSLGSSWILTNAIKSIVARPRPSPELVDVYIFHTTMSFPSGHVVTYVALFGFLFYLVCSLMPRSALRSALLIVLGALIGLVGVSRVYLGAHWASDALAGYCLGFAWLALMIQLYSRLKSRRLSGGEG